MELRAVYAVMYNETVSVIIINHSIGVVQGIIEESSTLKSLILIIQQKILRNELVILLR